MTQTLKKETKKEKSRLTWELHSSKGVVVMSWVRKVGRTNEGERSVSGTLYFRKVDLPGNLSRTIFMVFTWSEKPVKSYFGKVSFGFTLF